MAFLPTPVTPGFPDVYQIETLDRVKGGPGGTANLQATQLVERTAFLKKQLDDAVSGALTMMYASRLKVARTISMSGDGSWSVTFDGSGNVISAMTLKPSVALTGTPTTPTAAAGTNTTQIASTAFVQAAIAALIASSPAALDTLNELATALGNDPNFATTMTNALAAKAPLASPALTGSPTAPTAAAGTNTTQLATTAFVQQELAGDLATAAPLMDGVAAVGSSAKMARENHVHPTDTSRAPLASPAFTGTPTTPTAAAGTNTTQIASTAFVQAAIAALIASSPAALDTLNELATALGNDPNFATTMTNALAAKAPLASPALTGNPTAPTPVAGDNDTSIATTAFVQAAILANFTGATQSLAANGYQKLPGGLILQWGSVSVAPSTQTTVTLPIAFPNAHLNSQATGTSTNGVEPEVAVISRSLTSITLITDFAQTVYWFVIGC